MTDFVELLGHPGVREDVVLRSSFGFLAFHGGSLERMTDVIATEAAARAGASLYTVVQPVDLRWHLPSHRISRHDSSGLADFLDHIDVAVALHGYGRDGYWTTLLLGGSNRALARHMRACLEPVLPGYSVEDDLDRIPAPLRGLHPDNPVNQPRAGGVHLELPPRVRGLTPRPGAVDALVDALATAARTFAHSTSNVPPARQ